MRKTFEIPLEMEPNLRAENPEIPGLQSLGCAWTPETGKLTLEVACETEAQVDDAAAILIAHFTPEADLPSDFIAVPETEEPAEQPAMVVARGGFLRNTFNRLITWWRS